MITSALISKIRKVLKLRHDSHLALYLLFDIEEDAQALARLDMTSIDREIEMVGIGDGSTVLCCQTET